MKKTKNRSKSLQNFQKVTLTCSQLAYSLGGCCKETEPPFPPDPPGSNSTNGG